MRSLSFVTAVRAGCKKKKTVLSPHYKTRGLVLLFRVMSNPFAVAFNFNLKLFLSSRSTLNMELAVICEKLVLLLYKIIRHHIRDHCDVGTNRHKLLTFYVL